MYTIDYLSTILDMEGTLYDWERIEEQFLCSEECCNEVLQQLKDDDWFQHPTASDLLVGNRNDFISNHVFVARYSESTVPKDYPFEINCFVCEANIHSETKFTF